MVYDNKLMKSIKYDKIPSELPNLGWYDVAPTRAISFSADMDGYPDGYSVRYSKKREPISCTSHIFVGVANDNNLKDELSTHLNHQKKERGLPRKIELIRAQNDKLWGIFISEELRR